MGIDRTLRRLIDRQGWLDTIGGPLQRYLNTLFPPQIETGASQVIQNVLDQWAGYHARTVL